MSVYVLRSVNLIKIGYSENIRLRVGAIISSSPVPVEFVGHMPGDREVEAHLHAKFDAARFSGEWFVESPAMRDFFSILLTPGLPAIESKREQRRRMENGYQDDVAERVRNAAKARWPHKTIADRIDSIAEETGWPRSRAKDVYYSHSKIRLRAFETPQIEEWLSKTEDA